MPTPVKQSVPFSFQDPSGNPLAGGKVILRLSADVSTAASSGPQVSAGVTVSGVLDINGSVTLSLWPNNVLFPAGTVYFVSAYAADGQLAWSGQISVIM